MRSFSLCELLFFTLINSINGNRVYPARQGGAYSHIPPALPEYILNISVGGVGFEEHTTLVATSSTAPLEGGQTERLDLINLLGSL
jgi:hypothetical protein